VVHAWKADLESKKKSKIAVGLADPEEDAELFSNWEESLSLEAQGGARPAQQSDLIQVEDTADLVQKMNIGNGENGSLIDNDEVEQRDQEIQEQFGYNYQQPPPAPHANGISSHPIQTEDGEVDLLA